MTFVLDAVDDRTILLDELDAFLATLSKIERSDVRSKIEAFLFGLKSKRGIYGWQIMSDASDGLQIIVQPTKSVQYLLVTIRIMEQS